MNSDNDWEVEEFDGDRWAPLAAAAEALLPRIPVLSVAYLAISDLITAGRLSLRAGRVIVEERDEGDIRWRRGPGHFGHANRHEPIPLRSSFFANSTGWKLDDKRCDWHRGVLVAVRTGAPAPSWASKKIVDLRRVALDVFLRPSEFEVLFSIPDVGSHPTLFQTAKANAEGVRKGIEARETYCAPGLAEQFMEEFRREIASGEFDKKYPNPLGYGVRAQIGREFSRRMMESELFPPSPSTIKRKVDRLLDVWTTAKRQADRVEPG